MQDSIKVALRVQVVQQYEKYLGLPSFIGRGKKASFDNIKQRVWKKLQGWEGKLLSQAGREVLIKAVAQALPTYTMSCFKLHAGLCHEIEGLIKKKIWGQRGDSRKIHWIKWEDLYKSSLFYQVFKAKYFPHSSVMEATNPSSSSYAWKSVLRGRDVIKRGAI